MKYGYLGKTTHSCYNCDTELEGGLGAIVQLHASHNRNRLSQRHQLKPGNTDRIATLKLSYKMLWHS